MSLKIVIKNFQQMKSLGPDEATVNYIKHLEKRLKPVLLKLFKKLCRGRALSTKLFL